MTPQPDPAATAWAAFQAALLAFQRHPTEAGAHAVMAAQAPFLVAFGMTAPQQSRQAESLAAKLAIRLASHSDFRFPVSDFRGREATP